MTSAAIILAAFIVVRSIYFTICEIIWRSMQKEYIRYELGIHYHTDGADPDLNYKVNSIRFSWKLFWEWWRWPRTSKLVNIPFGRNHLHQEIVDHWKSKS